MLNGVFVALIAGAVLFAAVQPRPADPEVPSAMQRVMDASIDSARSAVDVAIGLLGVMVLWLGLMRVLRDAGLLRALARVLAPLMRWLFPDVPAGHPALGAMIMNIAANMLGLGNAATPFGLKAMQELERLNPRRGVATDSMALFLAINTSGVAVMPLGVIAVRASLGSQDAAGIFVPTVLATLTSTVVAVLVAKSLQGRALFAAARYEPAESEGPPGGTLADGIRGLDDAEAIAAVEARTSRTRLGVVALCLAVLAFGVFDYARQAPASLTAFGVARDVLSSWLLPALMLAIVLFGFSRRTNVYDSMITGAREGFDIFVMIIPFLVAILVAVGVFRASGALDWIAGGISSITAIPAEAFMMGLVRPLSGSGALGVMTETMRAHGPDSFVGYLVSTMSGSTETTFYVLALYLGSVQVRAARHTLAACLAADLTGFVAALFWCRLFFA